MTVSYADDVATCGTFSNFLKLLFRWRASIYKLVWKDLLIYLSLYYILTMLYNYVLNEPQKYVFECLVFYCNSSTLLIPLSFVLGFYVKIVVERWWGQYMTMPWPDPIAVYVSALLVGQDEQGRLMRRTVMRYVCLCLTMVLTMISPGVKKRFPTLDHLMEAGLLVENERNILVNMDEKFPKHPKHWMPIVWAASIVMVARKEGRIRDEFSLQTIMEELNKFRKACTTMTHYDTISIPLVYTQVVTLAVYSYFLGSVMAQQWTDKHDRDTDYYIIYSYLPFFPTLEFFFYMGWLKVAESLISPFGEDDDDFEVNWLIDRNLTVCYLIVDEMHHQHPVLVKDQYWDEIFPNELPYPATSDLTREEPPEYSTAKISISKASTLEERDATVHYFWSGSPTSSMPAFTSANASPNASPKANDEVKGSSSDSDAVRKPSWREVRTKPSGTVRISEFVGGREGREAREGRSSPPKTDGEPASPDLDPTDADQIDEFAQLRDERERERVERQMQRFVRTLDAAAATPQDSTQQSNGNLGSATPPPPDGSEETSEHSSQTTNASAPAPAPAPSEDQK